MRNRLSCFLMVLILGLLPLVHSSPATSEVIQPAYPEATLYPDAPKYDADHPEKLDPDQLYAWSAILIESSSGMTIFEKSPDVTRFPASTTKIMTVLLGIICVEDLDMEVTVSATAIDVPSDSSTMKLQEGEILSFRDILYGTMLLSANDGANVIAETVSGSIPAFVDLMNNTAVMFGCTGTHFNNAHGYTDPYHYTTSRDLAIIAREAMKNDTFREIVNTYSYSLPKTNMTRARTITNTNELFNRGTDESPNKYYYPAANGIKTGNTEASQYCFVGSAVKNGVELISVVMYTGKRSRWADTIKLMDYGFSQYTSVTPLDLYNKNPITIETSSYSTQDAELGRLRLSCVATDAAAAAKARIVATFSQVETMAKNLKSTVLIQYTRDFKAPISNGEIMGTMTYFTEDGDPVVYNLIASRTVKARENIPKTVDEIMLEVLDDPNPLPKLNWYIVADVVLFVLICIIAFRVAVKITMRRHPRGSKIPKTK